MKFIKKLYGYGKSVAKHVWDTHKGYAARKVLKKGIDFIKKKIPQKYKNLAEPII